MKTDRKFFILVESLLAAAAVVIGAILVIGPAEDNRKTVSFIVEDVDDESNSALLYGMKQAASDNDVNLKILSSDKLRDSDTFSELLSQAKAKGTSCYIIEPSMKGDLNQSIMDLSRTSPVMLIHSGLSDISEDNSIPVSSADNYAMGAQVAKEIKKDFKGQLTKKKIGLLMGDADSIADEEKVRGFTDEMDKTGSLIRWRLYDSSIDDANHEVLRIQTDVDIVAAMDDYSLRIAAANMNAGYRKEVLYGIGTSERALYYLDNQTVSCEVVPDEFAIGYNALNAIVSGSQGSKKASFRVLRKSDMFDEGNQELLYSMTK